MISANIPNSVRKAVYKRDGYMCALCGDTRQLQIHSEYPTYLVRQVSCYPQRWS